MKNLRYSVMHAENMYPKRKAAHKSAFHLLYPKKKRKKYGNVASCKSGYCFLKGYMCISCFNELLEEYAFIVSQMVPFIMEHYGYYVKMFLEHCWYMCEHLRIAWGNFHIIRQASTPNHAVHDLQILKL